MRRALAIALVASLVGCASDQSPREDDRTATVELVSGRLPQPLTFFARHCWLLVRDEGASEWQRWEVYPWQGARGLGHVSVDRAATRDELDHGVGGEGVRVEKRWRGERAAAFILRLRGAARRYVAKDRYLAWPGPNSNGFVDAMLREGGLDATLPPTAVGKDYRGLAGASLTSGGTGVQLETPLLGFSLGLREGIELHVLSLTFGVHAWPPALLTPCGRIGFDEE